MNTPLSAIAPAPWRFDRLDAATGIEFFGVGPHAVPISLRRAPKAQILWLNQRVMHEDPVFQQLGGDVDAYKAHLLKACAYMAPEDGAAPAASDASDASDDTVLAYADRYGGSGLGANGGSGRAALVNGYLVKGVGRTPLIGIKTDATHASGGAYLEEAVRESIFAEVLAAEFVHGAVPTLAIIDTGVVQIWNNNFGPEREKRVLLVRPCLLRPAHFERAVTFHAANPKEGALDLQRVRHHFQVAEQKIGTQQLLQQCEVFTLHWAEQLAYAFVHRLSPSGNSTSNICFDGKLLDFGACAAVPSWAQVTLIPGSLPAGSEFSTLVEAVQSLCYYFGRCLHPALRQAPYIQQLIGKAWAAYARRQALEVLRVCGLSRQAAASAVDGPLQANLNAAVKKVMAHFRRERYDIYSGTPEPNIAWDIVDVWQGTPPLHLAALRTVLDEIVAQQALNPSWLAKRCAFIAATRPVLFREELKTMLHPLIDGGPLPAQTPEQAIAQIIAGVLVQGRSDSWLEWDDALPYGFAVAPDCSLALFYRASSGEHFAAIEWQTNPILAGLLNGSLADSLANVALNSGHDVRCLPLQDSDAAGLVFANGVRLPCMVHKREE